MNRRDLLAKAIKNALEVNLNDGQPFVRIAAPYCCCYVSGKHPSPLPNGSSGGCHGPCKDCICQRDPFCCEKRWDSGCVSQALEGGACADQCQCPHGAAGNMPMQPGRRPPDGYIPGPNHPWPYSPDGSYCANPCYLPKPSYCDDWEPYYGPFYPPV